MAHFRQAPKAAAAFADLGTSYPSAATFEGVPLAWPWYLPRPCKLFLLDFKTAMWHVLGRQPSAAAFEGVPLAWPWYLPTPRKLFLLGFEFAMWQLSKASHLLGHGTSLGPYIMVYK